MKALRLGRAKYLGYLNTALTGDKRNAHKYLVGRSEERRPLLVIMGR